jgi:chromosome segregation ATPase
MADDSRVSGRGWHEVWTVIKEVGDGFREARFPSRTERETQWSRFQAIVESVKEAQRVQSIAAEANRDAAAARIRDLKRLVDDAADGRTPWKEVWAEFGTVRGELKAMNLGRKTEREEVWERLNALNDRARREFETQSDRSARCRNEVTSRAEAARPIGAASQALIDGIFGAVVDVLSLGMLRRDVDERKEYLLECSQTLKQARELFAEYKAGMFGRDKHEAFETIRSVQEALDAAWTEWKEMNGHLREQSHQAYEARQEAREARNERRRENIARNRERLERLEQALSKQEAHLDDLREKRDSAWNDDFRDRVEGWIDEAERSIDDIREKIVNVERWIEEDEDKIR